MTSPSRASGDRIGAMERISRFAKRAGTRLGGSSPLRPTSLGGVVCLLASVAVSIASYGALEESMRIRWTIGTHYGPEYASTAVVLAAFPLGVAAAVAVSRAAAAVLERTAEFDAARAWYELAVLAVLLWLLLAQVALVVANLL